MHGGIDGLSLADVLSLTLWLTVTALQCALESERELKDFRFLADTRNAPLDNLPKIVNGSMLRRFLFYSVLAFYLFLPSFPSLPGFGDVGRACALSHSCFHVVVRALCHPRFLLLTHTTYQCTHKHTHQHTHTHTHHICKTYRRMTKFDCVFCQSHTRTHARAHTHSPTCIHTNNKIGTVS